MSSQEPATTRASSLAPASMVTLLAFALYLATLAPGLAWGDGAELQRLAVTGGLRVDAHAHPMWLWVAGAFARLPFGEPSWRVNLSSAVFGALAVGLTFLVGFRLARRRDAAVLAALALAVSHTFWLHAVQTEVYALFMALLALTLLVFVAWLDAPRPGVAAGLGVLIGLTLLSHMLVVTAAPGLALGVVTLAPKGSRLRAILWLVLGGLAGAALFVAIAGLNPFLHPVYGKGGPLTILELPHAGDLARWAAFGLYQFPLSWPLVLWGAWTTLRADRPLGLALSLVAIGDIGFTLCFRVADEYVFYLPSYLVAALFLARGLSVLPARWRGPGPRNAALVAALVLAPVALYRLAPSVAARAQRALVNPRTLPGRDNARFFLDPPKLGERSAERFVREACRMLPESAIVVADWAPLEPLVYVQTVEHARPDVDFTESRPSYPAQLDSMLALSRHRPVFLADDDPPPYYDIAGYRRRFLEVRPEGPLFRLVPRAKASVDAPR